MAYEPPATLIDPVTGAVTLRLVPHHLERLHGAYPKGSTPTEDAKTLGLPFPFLPNARPIDLLLRGGMTPGQIGSRGGFEKNSSDGTTRWWRWAAYASTPFGWVDLITPFFKTEGIWSRLFRRDRLSVLTFQRLGRDAQASFDAMEAWLRQELGSPSEAAPARTGKRTWTFPWGSVDLYREPRDGDAAMAVRWHRVR